MEELWYENVSYADKKDLVKENMVSVVDSFIGYGYWLKAIRDSREYEQDGYENFWAFAEAEFGLKMSEASRAMSMNDKYSVDGNSPYMREEYKLYKKGQLQEMLTMSEEQLEQVTPDTTVREMREIKNPAPEEPFATSQEPVNTESETEPNEELEEPILTEIEMAPEQEEELKVAFDTDELMQELDNVIEGEYREIQEKLSPYGMIKTVYPEGSLSTTAGCGHRYYCFSCAQDCAIRQEERLCYEAPLGAPYNCTTMNILQNLRLDGLSEECQFINLDLTERTWGSNEPVPCCKQCQSNECGYRCQRSVEKNNKAEWKELETDLKEEDRAFGSQEENVMLNADEGTHGLRDIKWILEKKNKELEEYLSVDGIPEDVIFEKKTIVGALASMVCELEEAEEQEAEISDILPVIESTQQPKLPKFKNNNERKAWLEDVEAWGLWYEDHNIEARYYKYDFPDGSRLIAVKYRYSCPPWLKHINGELDGTYKETYYQMIRSEKWRRLYYQKYYTHATESITALVDYLKEIQKGGTGSE